MFTITHGTITKMQGQDNAHTTIIIRISCINNVIITNKNLGKINSNASISLTVLLIMRPYGVVSKYDKGVRIKLWKARLNRFYPADIVYMNKDIEYIMKSKISAPTTPNIK